MTMGVRQAKYMKKNAATHCTCSPSLKSLTYHLAFNFTSCIRPPNNLQSTYRNRSKRFSERAVALRNSLPGDRVDFSSLHKFSIHSYREEGREREGRGPQYFGLELPRVLAYTDLPVRTRLESPCSSDSCSSSRGFPLGILPGCGLLGAAWCLRFSCTNTTVHQYARGRDK